jgi:NADPH-dependent 7-cyano-7-deazaguanine reductase QueF-like protein
MKVYMITDTHFGIYLNNLDNTKLLEFIEEVNYWLGQDIANKLSEKFKRKLETPSPKEPDFSDILDQYFPNQ